MILPSAPPQHDARNQNETRRLISLRVDELLARLRALENPS